MRKNHVVIIHLVPILHSFVLRVHFRLLEAFSFSQILRLVNDCSTFCLRYAESEPGLNLDGFRLKFKATSDSESGFLRNLLDIFLVIPIEVCEAPANLAALTRN